MAFANMNSNSGNSTSGNGNAYMNALASAMQPPDVTDMLIDYNKKYKDAIPAKFRDSEIEQTMAVLIGLQKPNVILTGPAGVGKTKVVEELARLIANDDVIVPDMLKNKVIYELPISSLVSGASALGELEGKTQAIISFASDPKNNCILFIDEIHQLMSDHIGQKIAQVLKPALARGEVKVIGATTSQEVRSMMDDPAFSRRFTKVIVPELTQDQTVEILRDFVPKYSKMNATVPDDLLPFIVATADAYASGGVHRPDSALTLLDRSVTGKIIAMHKANVAFINMQKAQGITNPLPSAGTVIISKDTVLETAKYAVSGSQTALKCTRAELEDATGYIKGQDRAKEEMIDFSLRYCMNLFTREKPMSALLCGPSGVGKTELVKVIAKTMTNAKPITLRMSEFKDAMSVTRIIGSSDGFIGSDSNKEFPFDPLQSNPYQVILLDEFEKADKNVIELFMQVFDEGKLRMARGNEIDFSKALIFVTTNAGYTDREGKVNLFGNDSGVDTATTEDLSNRFPVELLNRFGTKIAFDYISKDTYRQILSDDYKKFIKEAKFHSRKVTLPDDIDPAVLDDLSSKYDRSFGARPAEKAVKGYIEGEFLKAM